MNDRRKNKNKMNDRRNRRHKESTKGDKIIYTIIHNILSLILFFTITFALNLYGEKSSSIGFMFKREFWSMVIQVFGVYIVAGVTARVTSYFIIKYIFKDIRRFGDLNTGINKLSITYIITAFFTSIVFSLGIILLIQDVLFVTETIFTLIISYILAKSIVIGIAWSITRKL